MDAEDNPVGEIFTAGRVVKLQQVGLPSGVVVRLASGRAVQGADLGPVGMRPDVVGVKSRAPNGAGAHLLFGGKQGFDHALGHVLGKADVVHILKNPGADGGRGIKGRGMAVRDRDGQVLLRDADVAPSQGFDGQQLQYPAAQQVIGQVEVIGDHCHALGVVPLNDQGAGADAGAEDVRAHLAHTVHIGVKAPAIVDASTGSRELPG